MSVTTSARPVRATAARHGSPRAGWLVRDAVQSAVSQPVATLTAALVVAIVCLVAFATAGRSAAVEQQVMGRIDSVGTRLVTAVDLAGTAGLTSVTVGEVARSEHVTWAFALGPVVDVKNVELPRAGLAAPLRPFHGDLPNDLALVGGRVPRVGEAVVGVDAARLLGLGDVSGTVTDGRSSWPVVGVVEATGPLASLSGSVLVKGDGESADIRYLYVLTDDVAYVDEVAAAIPALAVADEPSGLEVESPDGALALREVLAGDLGLASRQLMATVLTIGLVLVGLTMFGAVSGRRRDYGRCRALGASRSTVVVLVLVQTGLAAVLGASVGCLGGLVTVRLMSGGFPDGAFTVGVGLLAVLMAAAGAVPPAIVASRRDPVRILRVA